MELGVIFVIAIIVVVFIFIIWFLPKALKDWSVAWGKGFKRVYYALALIITCFLAIVRSSGTAEEGFEWFFFVVLWAFFYLIAVMIFKSFTWTFGAFIKKKK